MNVMAINSLGILGLSTLHHGYISSLLRPFHAGVLARVVALPASVLPLTVGSLGSFTFMIRPLKPIYQNRTLIITGDGSTYHEPIMKPPPTTEVW